MKRSTSRNRTKNPKKFKGEIQLVVFKLKNEEFGVHIERVREIVRIPEITNLPRGPEFLCGISNLRGDIMPIIDTRKRLSMPHGQFSERTRVLVVDIDGMKSGLVVDEVSEVLRVPTESTDNPPATIKGIEKNFLESIVKINNGKRIIMTVNLQEILTSNVNKNKSIANKYSSNLSSIENDNIIEEEQIISFTVGNEEYGFTISKVREILRFTELTKVPNVPNYVKGLITVRNNLLPILDMRTMLGKKAWMKELSEILVKKKEKCKSWVNSVGGVLETSSHAIKILPPDECELGKWLNSPDGLPGLMIDSLKELRAIHEDLHDSVKTAIDLLGVSPNQATMYYEDHSLKLKSILDNSLNHIISRLEDILREEQRILVIEARGITTGLLVDTVNEVIRVPLAAIEDVSIVCSSKNRELRGVAKLNNGQRIIMIVNESSIISDKDLNIIETLEKTSSTKVQNKIDDNHNKAQNKNKQNEDVETETGFQQAGTETDNVELDEAQLVTFNLGEEEFGLKITGVQEINRLAEITKLPKTPDFVEGVTNLRGDVVPVIDLRKRFGMPFIERDDRTRIIISDIGGRKTGFIVDRVNEVLRISRKNIEYAGKIVSGMIDSDFVEALGKVDEQGRMVILLDIGKILTKNEVNMLKNLSDDKEKSKTKAKKKSSKATRKRNLTESRQK